MVLKQDQIYLVSVLEPESALVLLLISKSLCLLVDGGLLPTQPSRGNSFSSASSSDQLSCWTGVKAQNSGRQTVGEVNLSPRILSVLHGDYIMNHLNWDTLGKLKRVLLIIMLRHQT